MKFRRHHFRIKRLVLSVITILSLIVFVITTPPKEQWALIIFFVLFEFSLFFLCYFLFSHRIRALLLATGITTYMILRFVDLRHWLYPLLIAAIILCIEVYLRSRNTPGKQTHDIPKL